FLSYVVVLACFHWSGSWCHSQRAVGWAFHHRLGWFLDCSAAVVLVGRRQKCSCCKLRICESNVTFADLMTGIAALVQTFLCPCFLLDRYPRGLLHVHVLHSLPLPSQSRRR